MLNPFCASEVVERLSSCIPVEDLNKITQVAFARKGATVTKTSVASLISSLKALELTCDAIILRDVLGSYNGGSYNEEPAGGSQATMITGGSHEITVTDFHAINNTVGMNALRRMAKDYDMYFFTHTRAFLVDGKVLSIKPTQPISDDFQSTIKGQWVITWSGIDLPLNLTGLTTGLSEIPSLGVVTLESVGAGTASVLGQQITIPSAAALEVDVNFASAATTYGVDDESELPTGLVLNSNTGQLTGSVAADGEYTFNVIGRNACGIAGLAEITLIVT